MDISCPFSAKVKNTKFWHGAYKKGQIYLRLEIKLKKYSLHTLLRHTQGVAVYLHSILTLAVDECESSASCPICFTPEERGPGTH
jgi:hypothetical protein